ncbi:hypothetical protein HOLleu_42527 [Holothuria leucospilota]|uniref:Uncharacterized protein n=1 Tax=Holothuria leucospilota TaxID=206669 RepID=A0A9Q1BBK7_HOLLE|nr:hypothetical protein HOLleu_42527 [Holothuria leucospilota]
MNNNDAKSTRYKVDGKCREKIYEFHGCLWHGCPRCQPDRSVEIGSKLTMDDVYAKTQQKIKCLEQKFHVEEMWECEFDQLLKTDCTMKTCMDGFNFKEPLNPRNAFCGGPTNAVWLKYDCRQ